MVKGHPRQHRCDERKYRGEPSAERGDRGPGAEPDEAPADPEEGGAQDQRPVDCLLLRQVEAFFQDGTRALRDEAVGGDRDQQRPDYDEDQRRVPVPGDVEKVWTKIRESSFQKPACSAAGIRAPIAMPPAPLPRAPRSA